MRRIVCVLNMTGHPLNRIHIYCCVFVCLLNASSFVGVGVGVGVGGVILIPLKAIHLHLCVPLDEHHFFTFLSHELRIIDLI